MANPNNNIGQNGEHAITQRDFIRNICQFYSGTTLTDTQVDGLAPRLISSEVGLFEWPTSQYIPEKTLPFFTVNKSGKEYPFWEVVQDVVAPGQVNQLLVKPYNNPPFIINGENEKIIIENNCTTPFDTTIKRKKYTFEISLNTDKDPGIDGHNYDIKMKVDFSPVYNNEEAFDLIATGYTNTSSTITNKTWAHSVTKQHLLAEKTWQCRPTISDITLTIYTGTTSSTCNLPLIFTEPINLEPDEYKPAAADKMGGGMAWKLTNIDFENFVKIEDFPDTLKINASIKRAGAVTTIYLDTLNDEYCLNRGDENFKFSKDIGQQHILINPSITPDEIKQQQWCLCRNSVINHGSDTGFWSVIVDDELETPPMYDKIELWEKPGNAFQLLKHGCKIDKDMNTAYGYARYAFQNTQGVWIVPYSATTINGGTNLSNSYASATTDQKIYPQTAYAFIAKKLNVTGDAIYISGDTAARWRGEHNVLVPLSFKFAKHPQSKLTKYSIYLTYTGKDGTKQEVSLQSGKFDGSDYVGYIMRDSVIGGDMLTIALS